MLLFNNFHGIFRDLNFFSFGQHHFAVAQGGRRRHNTSRDKGRRISSKRYVSRQNATTDSGKTRGHNGVQFRISEILQIGFEQERRLALSQKYIGGAVHTFANGRAHKKLQHLPNNTHNLLHDSVVVQDVDEKGEEVNGGDGTEGENTPVRYNQVVPVHEGRPLLGIVEEDCDFIADALENVPAHLPADGEQSENELQLETPQYGVPVHLPLLVRHQEAHQDENQQPRNRYEPLRVAGRVINQIGEYGGEEDGREGQVGVPNASN